MAAEEEWRRQQRERELARLHVCCSSFITSVTVVNIEVQNNINDHKNNTSGSNDCAPADRVHIQTEVLGVYGQVLSCQAIL